MGVRLYPNTTVPAALEVLAGVPAGTHDRLEAVNAKFEPRLTAAPDFWARNAVCEEKWNAVNADPAVGTLDAFLTFGWGKFRHVPGLSDGYAGRLADPAHARMVFQSNGIDADPVLAEGVHWC